MTDDTVIIDPDAVNPHENLTPEWLYFELRCSEQRGDAAVRAVRQAHPLWKPEPGPNAINRFKPLSRHWIAFECLCSRERAKQAVDQWHTNQPDTPIELDCSRIFAVINGRHEDSLLHNADLRDLDLRRFNLRFGRFYRVDFRGADLRGADFRGACMADVTMNGANLSGANFNDALLVNVDLRGANLNGAKAYNLRCSGTRLDRDAYRLVKADYFTKFGIWLRTRCS